MHAGTRTLQAVILDLDGTLIDSNDAHAHAWVDTGADMGYDIRFEVVRPLIGMGEDRVMPELTGVQPDSREGRRISERRAHIFDERWLPRIGPFPRTRDLLERMRSDGLKLVVATSAGGEKLAKLLRQGGIEDLVQDATTSDDAAMSKPAPDIVQAALRRCGCDRQRVVMIGDTPYDVEAARRAGIPLIAFRCGGWTDPDLQGAVEVYDGPGDLLALYDASLVGRRRAR